MIKYKKLLFYDFPPLNLDKVNRMFILTHPKSFQKCDLRIRQGMVRTPKEEAERRLKILKKKLP